MATRPMGWVLVAGSGTFQLPEPVLWCAQALGRNLAAWGYGLITGGWPGVDHVVARSFAEELTRRQEKVLPRLTQVVKRGTYPDYRPGGTAAYFEDGFDGFATAVQRADAIVLLGGMGATSELAGLARQQNLAILPIPGTGGDASRVYEELLRNWPVWRPPGLTTDDFAQLNAAIDSSEAAEAVVAGLEGLLHKTITADRQRDKVFLCYSRKDCVWLNLVKLVLEQYVPRERLVVWDDTQIPAGERFEDTILAAIRGARTALLLVSRSFWQSRFIRETELPALLEARAAGRLKLEWIPIEDCDSTPLADIQAAHPTSRPLSTIEDAREQVEAVDRICRDLAREF